MPESQAFLLSLELKDTREPPEKEDEWQNVGVILAPSLEIAARNLDEKIDCIFGARNGCKLKTSPDEPEMILSSLPVIDSPESLKERVGILKVIYDAIK